MSGVAVRGLEEVMRDEMAMRDRIAGVVRKEPRTIPEIAAALACPVREVTLWVMALRRYGVLEELPKPKSEDYYRYRLSNEAPAAEAGD
jgi:hypothetical protein